MKMEISMAKWKKNGWIAFGLASLFAFPVLYGRYQDHQSHELARAVVLDINNPEITTRMIENTLVLEGVTMNEVEKDKAEVIALAYIQGFRLKNLFEKPKLLNLIELKTVVRETASSDSPRGNSKSKKN